MVSTNPLGRSWPHTSVNLTNTRRNAALILSNIKTAPSLSAAIQNPERSRRWTKNISWKSALVFYLFVYGSALGGMCSWSSLHLNVLLLCKCCFTGNAQISTCTPKKKLSQEFLFTIWKCLYHSKGCFSFWAIICINSKLNLGCFIKIGPSVVLFFQWIKSQPSLKN